MNRRDFLFGGMSLATSLSSCRTFRNTSGRFEFEGEILGAAHEVGHLLRGNALPAPSRERNVPVVIVGAGIAGLSAGWKLHKSGVTEFEILELEDEVGGNARWGSNRVTAYPWGAHYVPFPTPESRAVRELLVELGVILGYDAGGRPLFDERYVCAAPQERLYIHGRWQDGLLPMMGASSADLDQYARFKSLVARYRDYRDADGRKAFAIPMEFSSRDERLLALDRISMHEFLKQRGFDSEPFHWHIDYCCRDDYGGHSTDVSAWAGLHYFASRDSDDSESSESTLLTWPEGNGWIVRRMRERLKSQIRTHSLVYRLERSEKNVVVLCYDTLEKNTTRIVAENVVFACPRFLAARLLSGGKPESRNVQAAFEYAPWMVANLTLTSFPEQRSGVPLAWDNVIYGSASLGYVVATHQSLQSRPLETVLTYYHALAGTPVAQERQRLLDTDWESWAQFVVRDLSRPHPEIGRLITRLDIIRWGHAMICPRPGFLWGEARRLAADPQGNIYFAHSDLSGLSLFEEAQYRGVLAAERILVKHGVRFASSL